MRIAEGSVSWRRKCADCEGVNVFDSMERRGRAPRLSPRLRRECGSGNRTRASG